MRTMILFAAADRRFGGCSRALADDERGCSLARRSLVAVNASFRANVSLRPNERAPVCLRETRPLTPSCFSATAMLTQ